MEPGEDFVDVAGEVELLAGMEDDDVVAGGVGVDFADAFEVDDDGAAKAAELFGGEAGFEAEEGFTHDVVALIRVQDGIVGGGFDVVHGLDFEKENLAAVFDREAVEVSGAGRRVFLEPVREVLIEGGEVAGL